MNSMLETIPVKTEVDDYIGIDYSLVDHPVLTSRSLDMHFRVRDTLTPSADVTSLMTT